MMTTYAIVKYQTEKNMGKIPSDYYDFIVGISRGGLFPAMVISTKWVKPLAVAYIDKKDEVYFDRIEWIKGKSILLVDDILRTGKTMKKIKALLIKAGALSVNTFAVYTLFSSQIIPDCTCMTDRDVEFPWDENKKVASQITDSEKSLVSRLRKQ